MNSTKERELTELENRLALLKQEQKKLKEEELVAPPRTWIQKYAVPKKNGNKYYYYRLMEAEDKKSTP